MIGVICKTEQAPAVEEFFELFKTPWEHYEQGRAYDVVVATADPVSAVDARLLIVFGAEPKSTDAADGIAVAQLQKSGSIQHKKNYLPIYGNISTFTAGSKGISWVAAANGAVGIRIVRHTGSVVVRLGYDLFEEFRFLLTVGQPIAHANVPTVDLHIALLRELILKEGISLLEIPPFPADRPFTVCLTHDIDFVGIRNHKFDHTMWGFLYRSTVGALRNVIRGRLTLRRLFQIWHAAVSLPFVYLGWARDFWSPFEWYLAVEEGLPATYFLIPFKKRMGEHVPGKHATRRAAPYDIGDIKYWAAALEQEGCELGVHGIDAWHSTEKGQQELLRLNGATKTPIKGVRMHWLLQDEKSPFLLDEAGYAYDSSAGYNETVGYRNGTTQVFRPLGAKCLLELPMHIQDGALFFPDRLDLSEAEAEKRCKELIEKVGEFGGVLTLLWHDRSHGPERFWGDFYAEILQVLKSSEAWFATSAQTVSWFQKRRRVRFERAETGDSTVQLCLRDNKEETVPPLNIRVHRPSKGGNEKESGCESTANFIDIPWNGEAGPDLHQLLVNFSGCSVKPVVAECPAETGKSFSVKG